MRKYFIICAGGRTASMWLATILNWHEDIFCAYSSDMHPRKSTDHLRTKEHNVALHNMGAEFSKLSIDQYFDILDKEPFSLVGSIHAYALWKVAEQAAEFKREYAIANVVREPVSRLQSGVNQMAYEMSFNEHAREGYEGAFFQNLDFAYPIEKEFGIQFDDAEDRLFLNAVLSMAIDKRNLEIEASHVRMEDLVSNINFLRNFIDEIGQGAAQVDMDFMMRVGNQSIPNSRAKKRQTPEEIFSGWSQWRRSLFTRLMDKLELKRIYEDMGYDLTYLRE